MPYSDTTDTITSMASPAAYPQSSNDSPESMENDREVRVAALTDTVHVVASPLFIITMLLYCAIAAAKPTPLSDRVVALIYCLVNDWSIRIASAAMMPSLNTCHIQAAVNVANDSWYITPH